MSALLGWNLPLSNQTLMGSRIATAIRVLAVGRCGGVIDGLPGDFCGFLARLLEEAVVAP
jgi:hypothetical protein